MGLLATLSDLTTPPTLRAIRARGSDAQSVVTERAAEQRSATTTMIAQARRVRRVRPPNGYNRSGWEPTVSGPLFGDFLGDGGSADEQIRQRLQISVQRSRKLARTNPYANRYFALYLANVIGEDGLVLKPRVRRIGGDPDALANRRLMEEWAAWGAAGNCTLDGELSWREVEDLAAVSWQRDGEMLIRLIRGKDLNRWGFVVEPIEADRLDLNLSTLRGGNEIRMGIEYELKTRKIVAYWILNAHPGDHTIERGSQRHTRVPVSDILHLFTRDRIGQGRGTPRLEPAMARLQMLGGYEEAEVVAARAGSSKFGVVTTETGAEYTGDADQDEADAGDAEQVFSDFGQGTVEQLAEGQKFELINPTHPTSQFEAAIKSFLRGISAGLPVNYNSLANDLEGVNFSSLRHGNLAERDQWRREQQQFYTRVSHPVYGAWLESSLMSDAIAPLMPGSIDRYLNVKWGGKRWPWIDPLKEAKGNEAALPFYGKTVTEIAQERGRTVRDIAQEIQEEHEVFAEFGIPHPLDAAANRSPTEIDPDELAAAIAEG